MMLALRRSLVRSSCKNIKARCFSDGGPSFSSLLNPHHLDLVRQEKLLLKDVYRAVQEAGCGKDELDILLDMRSQMTDFFTMVVVGEFNSGKSTLINSMLGERHLEEGFLPTTHKINIIRSNKSSSSSPSLSPSSSQSSPSSSSSSSNKNNASWKPPDNFMMDDVVELNITLDERMRWLEHIAIIDTPGTNAVVKKHAELTARIIPRADLIVFVTSAERPMSESESVFLDKIRGWGKKVIMVVNKVDTLRNDADRKKVLDYVSQNAAKILELGSDVVPVYGVSGRQALEARLWAGPGEVLEAEVVGSSAKQRSEARRLWSASLLAPFEEYLRGVLSAEVVIKAKLLNPLATSDRIVHDALKRLAERDDLLEADIRVLELVDENMNMFQADLRRDIQHYKQRILTVVERCGISMDSFISDNITPLKPQLLLSNQAFQVELSKHVDSDLATPINAIVAEMANVVSERMAHQAKAVVQYLGSRPQRYEGVIVGHVPKEQFLQVRNDLLAAVKKDMEAVLLSPGASCLGAQGAKELSAAAKSSMQAAAGAGVLSVGTLGGLLFTQALTGTGIVAASGLAVAGLAVVPWRRKAAREDMANRFDVLKTSIDAAVQGQVDSQVHTAGVSIMDGIAPYSRFVRIEQQRLADMREELGRVREDIFALQAKIKGEL